MFFRESDELVQLSFFNAVIDKDKSLYQSTIFTLDSDLVL